MGQRKLLFFERGRCDHKYAREGSSLSDWIRLSRGDAHECDDMPAGREVELAKEAKEWKRVAKFRAECSLELLA